MKVYGSVTPALYSITAVSVVCVGRERDVVRAPCPCRYFSSTSRFGQGRHIVTWNRPVCIDQFARVAVGARVETKLSLPVAVSLRGILRAEHAEMALFRDDA